MPALVQRHSARVSKVEANRASHELRRPCCVPVDRDHSRGRQYRTEAEKFFFFHPSVKGKQICSGKFTVEDIFRDECA